MRRNALVIASLVAGLAGSIVGAGDAAAQPGQTPVAPPALASGGSAPQPVAERGELSEGLALGLSLGATTASWGTVVLLVRLTDGNVISAGPLVLGGLGTFFGPSFGHVYARRLATRGLGLRALGAVAAVVGIFQSGVCETCESDLKPLFWVGAAVYLAGSLDDIITAPLRARRHNRRLERERAQRLTGVTLAPLALPGPRGGLAGLSLGGRF